MEKKLPSKSVLSSYNEITQWEEKLLKPSRVKQVIQSVAKPMDWIFELVPNKVTDTIAKAIEGMLGGLLFISDYTFKDESVLKCVEKYGSQNICALIDLKNQRIESLKKAASSYITENNILAALQGFGCGLGGVGLIAADIPLLFGIAFRVIQQIGGTFGYDMSSIEEKRFIMQIIDFSTGLPTAGKVKIMFEKEALKQYAKNVTFKEMERIAAIKSGQLAVEDVAKEMLKVQGKRATQKAVQQMSEKIAAEVSKNGAKAAAITSARQTANDVAKSLTRKKLGQMIPILGGLVGAGFNFWFLRSIGETAYFAYLKRHIVENYEV